MLQSPDPVLLIFDIPGRQHRCCLICQLRVVADRTFAAERVPRAWRNPDTRARLFTYLTELLGLHDGTFFEVQAILTAEHPPPAPTSALLTYHKLLRITKFLFLKGFSALCDVGYKTRPRPDERLLAVRVCSKAVVSTLQQLASKVAAGTGRMAQETHSATAAKPWGKRNMAPP